MRSSFFNPKLNHFPDAAISTILTGRFQPFNLGLDLRNCLPETHGKHIVRYRTLSINKTVSGFRLFVPE
jgi:hypothetical protein